MREDLPPLARGGLLDPLAAPAAGRLLLGAARLVVGRELQRGSVGRSSALGGAPSAPVQLLRR